MTSGELVNVFLIRVRWRARTMDYPALTLATNFFENYPIERPKPLRIQNKNGCLFSDKRRCAASYGEIL